MTGGHASRKILPHFRQSLSVAPVTFLYLGCLAIKGIVDVRLWALAGLLSLEEHMGRVNLSAVMLFSLFGALLSACGGGAPSSPPPPPPPISVVVSPNTATVQAGSTDQLVAIVINDAGNAGVSWSVTCSSADCGSVSPGTTLSGKATVYTPPATLTSGQVHIIVTATSVTDKSQSSSATLIPVGHVATYEVGVDYHSTGIDIDATGFIAAYNDSQVRQTVQMQLQGMADRGANFIHTSMWVAKPPGQTCCSNAQITFPMTAQEAANLRAYAQDVAAIQSSAGSRLRLDLALMWGGASDYTVGSPATGLGMPAINATQFVSNIQSTTDQVLSAVSDVTRPDGVHIVDTIFFDYEVTIGNSSNNKPNEDWLLTTNYPRFASVVSASGLRPAVYFIALGDQADVLDATWIDPDYAILNSHHSMFWIYRGIKFFVDNSLPLPSRIDFSSYIQSTGATYEQLLQHILDDADATLPSLGAPKLYGAAETYYLDDANARYQYGQAFAAQAALSPRMQRVSFWTNGAGAGQNGSTYPFTIEDYLPPVR